jgi:hypothetical protein
VSQEPNPSQVYAVPTSQVLRHWTGDRPDEAGDYRRAGRIVNAWIQTLTGSTCVARGPQRSEDTRLSPAEAERGLEPSVEKWSWDKRPDAVGAQAIYAGVPEFEGACWLTEERVGAALGRRMAGSSVSGSQ